MLVLFLLVASALVPHQTMPSTAEPGHFAEPQGSENAAALARNAALITRLERAVNQGANRIALLVEAIEKANVARGRPPSPPPPPPPPPPYIELATIAQQTAHIARLRDELVRQQRVTPRLERTLRRVRRR